MPDKLKGTDAAVEHAEVIAGDVAEIVQTGGDINRVSKFAVESMDLGILTSDQVARAIEKGFLDAGKKKENG